MPKIKEMKRMVEEMKMKEFKSVFTKELFDTIGKMIEEKTLPLESALVLLKFMGCRKALKDISDLAFNETFFCKRMKEMIIDENEKKSKEKNERRLIDICECYLLLNDDDISDELISICVPRLLKAALNKEGNEETQKEVEIA
eukprot:MONOS_14057.1-p1 / transcript=MONOS_14057.1 / gene=MONOS_14057 / organism=Monocercomonoides_exilis_PA203 / gene_product=unspecified product / transcript_product=unspecified product / location=Mono_scaffold00928:21441-21869(-) / protein_length=143 / sequence_SO=supercontig / SO=protein_coding / is_pseudo=false